MITGSLTEKGSGAPLIGANIYLKTDLTVGTVADLNDNGLVITKQVIVQ